MSNKISCTMCLGRKVFYIKTFFLGLKGDIIPHKVKESCPICKGQGFLIVRTRIISPINT